jgi:plasmid maintenance system killer protein
MGIISYNAETKEIQFTGYITSFVFYNQLFDALREHYRTNGVGEKPILSFVRVSGFDAAVLPNLIGIGIILKGIHKDKIPLLLARVSSTKFLDNAGFFDHVGKQKLYGEEFAVVENDQIIRKEDLQTRGKDIYDFEPRLLGFYDNQATSDSYNSEHEVHVYDDDSYSYYIKFIDPATSKEELGAIRSRKYEYLKPRIEKRYSNILRKIDNKEQISIIINILTEIITNSVLYSGSLCAAMLQSFRDRIIISISDFGVGFEYSFEKKREKFGEENREVFNDFKEIDQSKYKNYLYIFETLNYSKKRGQADKRDNLFTLLIGILGEVVMGKNPNIRNGTMRIHYNDTQVVFTSDRCQKCGDIDPKKCARCLWEHRSEDRQRSPVRFFKSKFQGVHIEIEFKF